MLYALGCSPSPVHGRGGLGGKGYTQGSEEVCGMAVLHKPVKLAVVGGQRGAAFGQALDAYRERVELTAICDISEGVLARWRKDYPGIQTYTSYEEMLGSADATAVFLATPMDLHAAQAIQALEAGKHVVSEVIAGTTLDECWQLVEAVERTGLVYMLAENYCYMRPNMMVRNMAQQGVFGQITYAEGAYVHDCRHLLYTDDGELTWRGDYRLKYNGNTYPTHSLGPVAQWMGVNRPGGDWLVSVAAFLTGAPACRVYAKQRFGPDHPAAQKGYWRHADSVTTVIQTARQAVIVLRLDINSARPHNMTHYLLQGTQASYLAARRHGEDPLIWIDGRSPGESPGDAEWEALWQYADEYEHPYWRESGAEAQAMGHGGGDFFVLRDFIDAIQTGVRPAIDIYDAVTWSCIMPLSFESIARGGASVEIPQFVRNRE